MDPEIQELSTALESLKKRARAAVERLGDEGVTWSPGIPDTNSAAQLLTHMLGAESGTIHASLGGLTVNRNRDEEFSKPLSTAKDLMALIDRIDKTSRSVLESETAQTIGRQVATRQPGVTRSARDSVVGVLTHQSEHMGHIELTEQLWNAQKK
jgi:hypothetical protein